MGAYIRLLRLTEAGIKAFQDTGSQLQGMTEVIEAHGGKLEHAWITNGNYDMVSVITAPDDEAMKKMGVAIKKRGLYTGHTMSAMPVEELVAALSIGGSMAQFMEGWFKESRGLK